jgi:hypothetical protein
MFSVIFVSVIWMCVVVLRVVMLSVVKSLLLQSGRLQLDGQNTLAYFNEASTTKKEFCQCHTCGQCYKTFYASKLRLFIIS